MRMERLLRWTVFSAVGLSWAGCGDPGAVVAAPAPEPDATAAEPEALALAGSAAPGDPLPGLSADELARFEVGKEDFEEVETAADGLGPVFNDVSCAACHSVPAVGGGSPLVETRFGTTTSGAFDPMEYLGGSLMQVNGIGIAGDCNFAGELVPPEATLRAGRRTTPLFGLGLVDAIDDAEFAKLAARQARLTPGQAGRVAMVFDIAAGRNRPGRFGWKGQVPSLHQFSGDAYLNEMGITSPEFPDENCPQGDCSLLEQCNPFPGLNDDGAGVTAFEDFMKLLAPPAPPPGGPVTARGRQVFDEVGCINCHVEKFVTRSAPGALGGKVLRPYSDFLLHDMGSLGDGIALGAARGNEFRTAPLWGLRHITSFLHDGRASTIEEAIQAHDGQGAEARDAFDALPPADRRDLLRFLGSL